MKSVFQDINRLLKVDGLLVFTFHHKRLQTWGVLLNSLIETGFVIVNVYPVRSEMGTSTQIRKSKSIEIDVIFVCKKSTSKPVEVEWKLFRRELMNNTNKRIKSFSQTNQLSAQDCEVIKVGETLRLISQHYPLILEDQNALSIQNILERVL